MQSHCDFPGNVVKRFSSAERNGQLAGKENCSPVCPQQKTKMLQKTTPKGPQKSKLPVPAKAREPPDFHKLHQTWQSRFQKGKAVSKKSCTRTQPFNFSQKGERSQAQTVTEAGSSKMLPKGPPPLNRPASLKTREPLAEVVYGQNNKESSGSEVEFKADPAALHSILSNIGVPIAPVGKVSLAQRVPVRASSIAHSHNASKNVMVRNSMYSVPSNRNLQPANLDRMSCFSKMTVKANDQKLMFRHQIVKMPDSDATPKEATCSKKENKPQAQENPLLQQMNTPCCIQSPKGLGVEKPKSSPVFADNESSSATAELCEKSEMDDSKNNSAKKPDTCSGDFVPDLQALASILSNTEMSIANSGKLSLAQRVPMQARSSLLKGTMVLSGSSVMRSATPNPAHGPTSSANVSLKDVICSPFRVPNTLKSTEDNSGGSARRILQPKPSAVKFSQPYSLTKPPIFPKTPRALALEKANQRHWAEYTTFQTTSKSVVKWKDDLSPCPTSEVLCENEPDMEQIAVRLFLDGECPGSGKKKDLAATPQQQDLTLAENGVNDVPGPDADVSPCLQLHNNLHPAPSQQSGNDPPCSIASSVPLSFLSHPAVKALQSCTLGPCSLPDITRLRLQAAVSAKQRFWEARLDEECAFYTSQGLRGACRSCRDPVASHLQRQDHLHFIPIGPEESSVELSTTKGSSHPHSSESDHLVTASATVQLDCH